MDDYFIQPWDHLVFSEAPETIHEQYVPPELEHLARQVLQRYDMQVLEMILVTSKPDKGGAIWKLETDRGPRSLKVLHREPARSLFSIGAQEYMVNRGARVPSLLPSTDNALYVEAGGKLWIVTDWITPFEPVSKADLTGAAALCYGLGEFHHYSKGYTPPFGSRNSSRLYGWPRYYEKIMEKFGWFRHIAEAYPETAASAQLLSVIDEFETQAKDMYHRFQESSYTRMIAKGEAHWGLAHQDYGWSNGQMGPGGIWVIDLDGVAYDLPIRDLRKLMTSTMDDMGVWDMTWVRGMIEAYHQANPLDQETFELLWIDMAFPNEFYKHTKEMVFDPVSFLNTELEPILQRVLATETSKWQILNELIHDKDKYACGNYTDTMAPISDQYELPGSRFTFLTRPLATEPAGSLPPAIPQEQLVPVAPDLGEDQPPAISEITETAQSLPEPAVDSYPETVIEPAIEPAIETVINSAVDPTVGSVADSATEPDAKLAVELVVEPAIARQLEPVATFAASLQTPPPETKISAAEHREEAVLPHSEALVPTTVTKRKRNGAKIKKTRKTAKRKANVGQKNTASRKKVKSHKKVASARKKSASAHKKWTVSRKKSVAASRKVAATRGKIAATFKKSAIVRTKSANAPTKSAIHRKKTVVVRKKAVDAPQISAAAHNKIVDTRTGKTVVSSPGNVTSHKRTADTLEKVADTRKPVVASPKTTASRKQPVGVSGKSSAVRQRKDRPDLSSQHTPSRALANRKMRARDTARKPGALRKKGGKVA